MTGLEARQIVLARRPDGPVRSSDFRTRHARVGSLRDGECLLKTLYISIDPSIRGWLDDRASYLSPVGIGEVVRSFGLAQIMESRMPRLPEGAIVRGFTGWQDLQVSTDESAWTIIEPDGVPLHRSLGALGMPGLAAWVGMSEIARPTSGETVVVSAATGAVGSIAAQLAKLRGARVVGIAGGSAKCAVLLNDLGLDAGVDYRADDWEAQLSEATPDGVDVNFECVGGRVMEAAIARLNNHARMTLCGLIAGYNEQRRPAGPANFGLLLTKRVALTGFIASDHFHRSAEIESQIRSLMIDGKLRVLETIVEGLDHVVEAFVASFSGSHVGKLIVAVDAP